MGADDLEEGHVVGDRFLLKERLGGGAFGTVWLAADEAYGAADVALKVLHARYRESAHVMQRFAREAKVLLELDHPHIAKAYAFDARGEIAYFAMEYVAGDSLHAEIERRAETETHFTLDEVSRLVSQLGSALEHAHAKGVVHRDLKPANIVLKSAAGGPMAVMAKILDFGLAKVAAPASDQTTIGRMLGSWLYMSPEQVRGEAAGVQSDLFSLGAILFELLTLRMVFARDENDRPLLAMDRLLLERSDLNKRYDLLRRIVLEPRPLPSAARDEVGDAVDQAMLKALEWDAADRFQSAEEMTRAFLAALAVREVRARPNPALARAETAAAPSESTDQPMLPTVIHVEPRELESLAESVTGPPARVPAAPEEATRLLGPRSTDPGSMTSSAGEDPTRLARPERKLVTPAKDLDTGAGGGATLSISGDDAVLATQLSSPLVRVLPRSVRERVLFPLFAGTMALAVAAGVAYYVASELSGGPGPARPPIAATEPPTAAEPRIVPRAPAPDDVVTPRPPAPAQPPERPPASPRAPDPPAPQPSKRPPRPVEAARPPVERAPKRYADLYRLLADIEAHRTSLERVGELADKLQAEAERLPDKAARTSIKRCATASAVTGSAQELGQCLAQLSKAAEKSGP